MILVTGGAGFLGYHLCLALLARDPSTSVFVVDDLSSPRSRERAELLMARAPVRVRVVVPGTRTDQGLVRLASRRMYGELLPSGVKIFEYRSAMTHVKALLIDGTWAVIGTTNVDNRSFEHNDEVNVAFREGAIVVRLNRDFESDLAASDEITHEGWQGRSWLEKLAGPVCWLLERQQ